MPGNLLIAIYFQGQRMGKRKRTLADVRWKGEPQCLLLCSSFSYEERGIWLPAKQHYPPQGTVASQAAIWNIWLFVMAISTVSKPVISALRSGATQAGHSWKGQPEKRCQAYISGKVYVQPRNDFEQLDFKERDGAYRHLSLSASPQSSLEAPASHHRTNSDTAPTVAKSGEHLFSRITKEKSTCNDHQSCFYQVSFLPGNYFSIIAIVIILYLHARSTNYAWHLLYPQHQHAFTMLVKRSEELCLIKNALALKGEVDMSHNEIGFLTDLASKVSK